MKSNRWYHSLMLSVATQAAITVVSLFTMILNITFTETIENHSVHWQGECGISNATDDDGTQLSGLFASCQDEQVQIGTANEILAYFHKTNTGTWPVVECTYTISDFLESKSWDCTVQSDSERTS